MRANEIRRRGRTKDVVNFKPEVDILHMRRQFRAFTICVLINLKIGAIEDPVYA